MQIKLDPTRRRRVAGQLQTPLSSRFDETLYDVRAEAIIDLMIRTMGPAVYNQAIQDERAHLQGKLKDLDREIFAAGEA